MPITSNYTIGSSIRIARSDLNNRVITTNAIKQMPSNAAVLASLFDELEELKGEMFLKYYGTDLDLTGRLAEIIHKYKEELRL